MVLARQTATPCTPLTTEVELRGPFQLVATIGQLAHGPGDPTITIDSSGVWRASTSPGGAATVHLRMRPGRVEAMAWGPGAAAALEGVPDLIRSRPDPSEDVLGAGAPLVRDLQRRFAGLRLPCTGTVLDSLVPAVVEQKVPTAEAHPSYRALVRALGEPAPGPAGLILAPTATRLAATPYFVMHRFGIERRRADTMRRAAAVAGRLERGAALDPVAARARLEAVPGVGPWTSAEVVRRSHGDGDSLSVGDYHHAADVCFALAGEQDGTDARMLELLEPYRPHRARVVLLLAAGGVRRPRRAPRARLRRIAAI
ncbi:MAG TPA: hypothetical protein VFA11_19555 [Acidimicrobiales bacterium]|nr:hypothetical protein [Acidimicrobiales bacterium]